MAKQNSTPISDECRTLVNDFERFLYTHCHVNNRTASLYLGVVRRAYPLIGASPSHADVESFLMLMRQEGTHSTGYISVMFTSMLRFCEFLGRPINLVRPAARRLIAPITLTEAEIAIFLHATTSVREKAMMTVLTYSGIRNNEFCNMRVQDVDIPNGVLRVTEGKFNKQRTVAVTGECLGVLEQYLSWRRAKLDVKGSSLQPEDFLFVTVRHGNQLECQDLRKIVRVLAKRAGIDRRVWPHLMRHSLATNMVNRGAHMLTIKDQLGHVHIESTMVYVHRSQHAHTADYRQFAPSYL